jgi:hypothetical protein
VRFLKMTSVCDRISYNNKCLLVVLECVHIQVGEETTYLNNVNLKLLSQNPEKFNLP